MLIHLKGRPCRTEGGRGWHHRVATETHKVTCLACKNTNKFIRLQRVANRSKRVLDVS